MSHWFYFCCIKWKTQNLMRIVLLIYIGIRRMIIHVYKIPMDPLGHVGVNVLRNSRTFEWISTFALVEMYPRRAYHFQTNVGSRKSFKWLSMEIVMKCCKTSCFVFKTNLLDSENSLPLAEYLNCDRCLN